MTTTAAVMLAPPSPPYDCPRTQPDTRTDSRLSHCHPAHLSLSQQQIQNNYREFEEQARRKDADMSRGEVGDLQFERIFLGDSDDDDEEGGSWSEDSGDMDLDGDVDVEGLSEDGC